MNDTVHSLKEFHLLPWEKLDPNQISRLWTYGFGGYGFDRNQLWISIIDSNLDAEIWPLPAPIAAMLELDAEITSADLKRSLRQLIGAAGCD